MQIHLGQHTCHAAVTHRVIDEFGWRVRVKNLSPLVRNDDKTLALNMLVTLIVACEVGFWVILFLGLLLRYGFNAPQLGNVVLFFVPLLDLILLAASALDLHSGGTAKAIHGLAAVYLGVSLVYAHSLIKWMDVYVSYRFSNGPAPKKVRRYGWSHAAYEWRQWFEGCIAASIAAFLLFIAIEYVDQPEQTSELTKWFGYLFWSLVIWGACWPLWYSIFQKRKPHSVGA